MKWIVSLGVLVVVAVGYFVGYTGYKFDCNRFENSIEAKYNDNRNIHSNGWLEVKEKSNVFKMSVEMLQKLYDTIMNGRYGEDGSQASFQWIQEQNPQIDPETIKSVMQSVEIYRKRFAQGQTELLAMKQEYKNFRTTTWKGMMYNWLAGYPKLDMSKYDIVTSERTENAFETKRDTPLDF